MSVLAEQSSFSFRPDPAPAVIPVQPVKRGRGRPPGSKNKPKTTENSSRPSCPWPRGRGKEKQGVDVVAPLVGLRRALLV